MNFDVVIIAGPRVELWPSVGVRAVSTLCAESGLTVGQVGGENLKARGVLPLPGTGGIVLAEDLQKRVHRIQARALIRVTAPSDLPDPFPGWRSQGLIPISTAMKLLKEGELQWGPCTVILGTGNRALRLGSSLIKRGPVICVESYGQWGAKRFAGWEIERRNFEILGGKILEAKPVSLIAKGPLLWEFRLEDEHGVRVIDVARVVSAGPFRASQGVREYPPRSMLFELEHTSLGAREEDVDGWLLEEERGRLLAGKIIKSLSTDLGPAKDQIESVYKRARGRLKRYEKHRDEPFLPSYQGKWISASDARQIRSFSGVPRQDYKTRAVASIECIEAVGCNICEKSCPESAITFTRMKPAPGTESVSPISILDESKCTACGICVDVCPSSTPVLIQERENAPLSQLTFSLKSASKVNDRPWAVGELATLLNRRGETLGSGRVSAMPEPKLVQIEVPTHLVWEARGIKKPKVNSALDPGFVAAHLSKPSSAPRVEVTLNGEKRIVRDKIAISLALFETGYSRPQDNLLCSDGSCGLCEVTVDGVKKMGCQTQIHRGMAVRLDNSSSVEKSDSDLCPCLNISKNDVIERVRQGKLKSPEAVISATHVGEGKCHGQICCESFKRTLSDEGLDMSQWIDWQFPWSDWTIDKRS